MTKRSIIILVSIVVLFFIAGIVLLFGKKDSKAPETTTIKAEIKKLNDDQAISPVSSFDGSAIWYFTPDKRLFRANTDGSGLSEFSLPALGDDTLGYISWPLSGSDFIAVLDGVGGPTKMFYSDTEKQYVTLPENIQSFDWLPDSKRIVYIWKSGDNLHQQMSVANADATGFRAITDVFWPDYAVKASPDGNQVLVYRTKIQGDANKIYMTDLKTAQFQTLVSEGKNLGAKWLPVGNKFVFAQSSTSGYPRLFLFNTQNQQQTDLNINTDLSKILVDKEGKFLYAAVPKKVNSGDEFIKIDLLNFKQESFFQPAESVRAKDLFFAGTNLYFVNSQDGKIYYISK